MAEKEIIVTDETRAVVEHYLQKQYKRRAKRLAKKEAQKKNQGTYNPGTGKVIS